MLKDLKPVLISPNKTIQDAMASINANAMGFVILAEGRKFIGVITDGDIRRALLNGFTLKSELLKTPRPKSRYLVAPASEAHIAQFAEEHRLSAVPLLNAQGELLDVAIVERKKFYPISQPELTSRELEYVTDCINTGWISSGGKYINLFEKEFAAFCGTRHAIACSNGTAALHLALTVAGIGPGDEVIIPSLTFIATANTVRYCGAEPVMVDCEDQFFNIDPNQIEPAITPKTKAIIPVHLFGHPADMDPIMSIARKHRLIVIEDAAEAHGALYRNQKVGTIGDFGTFSFFGNKIITTGEGGMVTTNNPTYARDLRLYRDHGMSQEKRYWHLVLGFNYRMTNLQAAVGKAQMERIGTILEKHAEIAQAYQEYFTDIPNLQLPQEAEWAQHVYWVYPLVLDTEKIGKDREQIMKELGMRSVESRPFFPPVHKQPIYNSRQSLPVSERLYEKGICLPITPNMSGNDARFIAKELIEVISNAAF